MAFHHRKLIADTLNETLIQICTPYCDPTKNLVGVCPTGCIYLCYLTCKPSFLPQLSPPPPPPPCFPTTLDDDPAKRSHNIPLPLKLSLAILATTFSILCFYAIYRCCKSWYRSRHRSHPHPEESETHDDFLDGDHGPVVDHPIWYIRTVGLNPSIISAITICKYKKGEGLVEGTECSVCLNEFQEDETLRLLPKCNHAFHIPCIDTWLISHTNCPLCRAGIVRNLSTSPSPEMVVDNSIPVEETQLGISENNRESGRELRVGIAEEGEPSVENGTKVNEIPEVGSCDRLVVDEVQPVRRSVSLDSSSAAMISAAMATSHHPFQSHGNLDTQLVKLSKSTMGFDPKRVHVNQSLLRLVGSSSIGRSLQKGPILMKRSFSSGGKILLSRHSRSRSRDMVLPL